MEMSIIDLIQFRLVLIRTNSILVSGVRLIQISSLLYFLCDEITACELQHVIIFSRFPISA